MQLYWGSVGSYFEGTGLPKFFVLCVKQPLKTKHKN